MKERPMIFSGEMVEAILAGRKTMTRRVVKIPSWLKKLEPDLSDAFPDKAFGVTTCLQVPCSDGTVQRLRNPWRWPEQSRLWVKETLKPSESGITVYKENGCPTFRDGESVQWQWPSAKTVTQGCPRWASRITLEITDVRVERLQDMSSADARAEGVEGNPCYEISSVDKFRELWDSINSKTHPWTSNPWVWKIQFEVAK